MSEKRDEYIHARVPASLSERLAQRARERGETTSTLIFRAVAREVGHPGPGDERSARVTRSEPASGEGEPGR